jgi:hypothetical protein
VHHACRFMRLSIGEPFVRYLLLGILISSTISSIALAGEPQQEMRATPNNVPLQRGYGCVGVV